MIGALRNAVRISDLRRRILFTLGLFIVFRIGTHIPVPGVNAAVMRNLVQGGTLFGLLDLFSGGALAQYSVFAMGVMPYINAAIIMQLLTFVLPSLESLSKEGEAGQRQINQYTRYLTLVLATIEALAMSWALRSAIYVPSFWNVAFIALTLAAGTVFLMWLGEQITDRGIGNGISLLIFAAIVSRLPAGAARLAVYLQQGSISIVSVVILLVLGLAIIAAVVWVEEGQRRIPVQYAKRVVGRRVYGGQSTHIPLKVDSAGVIPIIFAVSILSVPATLAEFVHWPWVQAVSRVFNYTQPAYMAVYAILIIFFTFFYTSMTFNPTDVADNLRKYGGFIPGLRPGRPTAEYLERLLVRITVPGSLFLAAVAILPFIIGGLTKIPGLYLGGTALLIVVGVALETMKQIEAHLLMRHYQGFLR